MKHFIYSWMAKLAVVVVLLGCRLSLFAQTESEEPFLTFTTTLYETAGAQNAFTMVIAATDSIFIDVDCGFGKMEWEIGKAVFSEDSQSLEGTTVSGTVSSAGVVKLYGDASKIDYLNLDGCYIESIDLSKLTNLEILSMQHNVLKSLDLSNNSKLRMLYLLDNPFSAESPLVIGDNLDSLMLLEIAQIDYFDGEHFNLSNYPKLQSFDAYHNFGVTHIDPTGCPKLLRLSIDLTNVSTLDVSQNPDLLILNISDTRINSIDLRNNTKLQQLYCTHNSGTHNAEGKLNELDLTNNKNLIYLFCSANNLKELDVSECTLLQSLYADKNYLTEIDLSKDTNLVNVHINDNCMDFATLPFDPGYWNEYYYQPRMIPTDLSYAEGTELDFSSRVLRDGTTTEAALYSISELNPSTLTLLDESYFSYEDGKVTLKKAHTDSLVIAFINNKFPEAVLYAGHFKVKTADDFGKPDKAFSMKMSSANEPLNFSIGLTGATPENPKECYLQLGNSETFDTIKVTTSHLSVTPNVNTKTAYIFTVYVPEGVSVSALGVNVPLNGIDLTNLVGLEELNLANTGLYTQSLDLSKNRLLYSLDLSNNNLTTLSLAGASTYFSKNLLENVNVSNNQLTELTLHYVLAIRRLDISNNQLSKISFADRDTVITIDFSDADNLISIDVSNNKFTELDFTHCENLQALRASNNLLTSIVYPTTNNIDTLAIDGNKFTLATLPEPGSMKQYKYAPQADIQIATKGPCTDLSEQNRTIDSNNTVYVWKKTADGTVLTEGEDYTIENGFTRFNIEGDTIYCEMSHPSFPDFADDDVLKTTPILAAGMPTNVLATFKTTTDGEEVNLSLAAGDDSGIAIYFDWQGNDNLTQYLLGSTYRLFSATTKADTEVKVYTYEPEEAITVFSMNGASLSSFDGSRLNDAIGLTVANAGLSSITLPTNTEKLKDLNLSGNQLKTVDVSAYSNLYWLMLNDNDLTTLDVSPNKNLGLLSASNNQLNSVVFDNPALWNLDLSTNYFEQISLDGAPNLEQVMLTYNYLSQIDVSKLTRLRILTLSNNFFTFNTLPLPLPSYTIYGYANQAPVDAALVDMTVDLSEHFEVNGDTTVYRWFLDVPIINDEGELEGEELIEGTEYTIEDGVTTFLKSIGDVMCVMTNATFPDLYLYTDLFDVTTGLKPIAADNAVASVIVHDRTIIVQTSAADGTQVRLYNVNGMLLRTADIAANGEVVLPNVDSGAYVVMVGDQAYKALVP
ncbi:MAG: hypothetical protein ACI392_03285 [Paludibacteraceae bacterium]